MHFTAKRLHSAWHRMRGGRTRRPQCHPPPHDGRRALSWTCSAAATTSSCCCGTWLQSPPRAPPCPTTRRCCSRTAGRTAPWWCCTPAPAASSARCWAWPGWRPPRGCWPCSTPWRAGTRQRKRRGPRRKRSARRSRGCRRRGPYPRSVGRRRLAMWVGVPAGHVGRRARPAMWVGGTAMGSTNHVHHVFYGRMALAAAIPVSHPPILA